MITNTPCTVYTPCKDGSYSRTILDEVFWRDTKGINIQKYGSENANSTIILIPFAVNAEGKSFVIYKAFENPNTQWTLQPQKSYIIKGIIDIIPVMGTKISAILEKFDYRVVMSVDTNDFGSEDMQHWEVGAK